MTRPILYSFRRCPYAMRARLAIASANIACDLREIVLRDKAEEFLQTSPSATVPCLKSDALVIDESLDIMVWALERSDPEGWLDMPRAGHSLIETADGPFKTALDRYKYASRHDSDPQTERENAIPFIRTLEDQLAGNAYLFGSKVTLADMAILPFVRQFAHVDLDWFQSQDWPAVNRWLDNFKTSDRFLGIMQKYPKWAPGDDITTFPPETA